MEKLSTKQAILLPTLTDSFLAGFSSWSGAKKFSATSVIIDSQVRGSLVAMTNITFNLNILFRFFLVIYADGFVKRGQLDLKLFRQLYWLAWITFISIEFTMFAVRPIIRGDFHYATSRGRICIMVTNIGGIEDKEEDSLQTFITKIGLVVQLVYTLRFVKRIRKYVLGQCPRNNLSSIGRYRRNVVDLRLELRCSVLGSCFPGLDYAVRMISMNQTPAFAFFVNFFLLDGLLYLFFASLFFALSRHDIPSKRVIPEKYFFFISHPPQRLEPRRSQHIVSSLPYREVCDVSESHFPHVPYVRKMVLPSNGRQYKIINYISTREADAFHQQRRNGLWSETLRREKSCHIVQVEPFHPDEATHVSGFQPSHHDLSQPCSSKCYANGRFNYFKNS